ncbi:Protein FAR1-RELATED SEQUENCE 5 [Quillaja saponaria]|uniref:Protein FAR1-RELATED SEQUENCE n=1 Tax=Quillaja saponaria TaxID=32244 RepID=A0AAD7KUE9_QUISA|nr:Protein FAR1-RELATED SEQUENCE 5 [Quillaja saponaria]KAJ7945146.1 Protein FAR1-RELATED SEQUENCE 5 [Quillaja saponaria]
MVEGKEKEVNQVDMDINDDNEDNRIQKCGSHNDNVDVEDLEIRSTSALPSANLDDSRYYRMLMTDDVLAMQFDSYDAGESFYHKYASAIGFNVRKDDLGRNKNNEVMMRKWVCNKEGSRMKKYLQRVDRHRTPRPITRFNCPAAFRIKLDHVTHKWVVKDFVAKHTHGLAPELDCCTLQTHWPMEVDSSTKGTKPNQVTEYLVQLAGGYEQLDSNQKELKDYVDVQSTAEATDSDVENALVFLIAKKEEDPGLFYETKILDGRKVCLFWADSRSQLDYASFGDVMAIYGMNACGMQFVILAGVNHHHQTIVFGSALLDDATIEAYTWLLQTFLHVMHDNMPISVVSDGNKALRRAIQHVFPRSRHRLCTVYLERNAQSNFNDTSFVSDFKVCMLDSLSQDDFELKWKAMVVKYKLCGNQWADKMYKKRHMWAEAYLRGHFWADLRSTHVCEGVNKQLKRFLKRGPELYQFVMQFGRAVRMIRYDEAEATYDSHYSQLVPSTPLVKIEKHAAVEFTLESYKKFLAEMRLEALLFVLNKVEGSNCRIYTLGHYDHQNLTFEVVFRPSGPTIDCSCLTFETTGFPCSHAIHIIKVERLEEIPKNLIHSRWTKSAKSTAQFLHNASPPVSDDHIIQMVRYGDLDSSLSILCYLASKSDQGYNMMTSELARLTHQIEKLNLTRHASNSEGCGIPITLKDVVRGSKIVRTKGCQSGNMDKLKKPRTYCHSKNVDQINSRCPNLIKATVSVVDSNPLAICGPSDMSSDSEMQRNPKVVEIEHQATDPHSSQKPAEVQGSSWLSSRMEPHASTTCRPITAVTSNTMNNSVQALCIQSRMKIKESNTSSGLVGRLRQCGDETNRETNCKDGD